MSIIKYKLDGERLHIPEGFLEGFNRENLRIVEDSVELRRRGLFRYVDLGRLGYKKLKFLRLTDRPPLGGGMKEQLVASKVHHVIPKKKGKLYRITLPELLRNYAGIEKNCVMVKVEGGKPYIGIWGENEWKKYTKLAKNCPV